MVTKTTPLFLFLLLHLFSLQVSAQKKEQSLQSPFAGKTYDISWVVPSEDLRYMTFQKTHDYSADTLALVSAKHPNKILYQAPDVYPSSVKYTKGGSVFMSGGVTARLVNLTSLKEQVWNGIRKAFYVPSYERIVLFDGKGLRMVDAKGRLTEEITQVSAVQEKDERLFYTQKTDRGDQLFEWTPETQHVLPAVGGENFHVSYCKGPVVIYYFHDSHTGHAKMYLTDRSKQKTYTLPDYLEGTPSTPIEVSAMRSGRYFVTFATENKKMPQKSDVDIWYGNDNKLENKFYNDEIMTYAIWNPEANEIRVLDYERFPMHIDTGEGRYLLASDPKERQDYTKQKIKQKFYRYDTEADRYEEMGDTGLYQNTDKDGKYLLSHDNDNWVVYTIATNEKRIIAAKDVIAYDEIFFSSDGNLLLFPQLERISTYDLRTGDLRETPLSSGYTATVAHGMKRSLGLHGFVYRNWYEAGQPLLIKVHNYKTSAQSLGLYQNERFQGLVNSGSDHLTPIAAFPQQKSYLYLRSNYNLPPVLTLNTDFKDRVIYRSNPEDTSVSDARMEKIAYTNSKGVALSGVLFYPSKFDQAQKYPMVVGIYELMRSNSNRYLRDGFAGKVEGINIRYYLDRGYFIYLPDIVFDGRGTGRSALDCVESAVAALKDIESIDFGRLGLVGHSHGGYEANFIATQSRMFAAYVGGAGNSDLVRSYHSFNYDFISPFYWQFEEQQYRLFKSFAEDKNLYIDNSPVYHAEKVTHPILLWTGTNDQNIYWEQTMEYYLALRRNNKKVIALFYDKEGHSFSKKQNREDLFLRISDWFDYHLKGIRKDWIDVINS